MQRLILFDIDNTLISINHGNRPQRQTLNTAFEQVYGIANAFEEVVFTGGMDLPLMIDVYQRHGSVAGDSDSLPGISDFKVAYLRDLTRNLESWTAGTVCVGVPELLETLASNPSVQLGLETGNFRETAFIKLRRYGLDGYFKDGGFGGDHTNRDQLVASAAAACQHRSGRTYRPEEIFVIGDSPADIQAGSANRFRTMAVATGSHRLEYLAELNPTYALPDLSCTDRVRSLLLGT